MLYRLVLILAGAFATGIIALGGLIAHGAAMAEALGPGVPLAPAVFALLLVTYAGGLGVGWLVWNRKG